MKVGDRTDETFATARAILAYLLEHPVAEDSLEGIAQWWMLERDIKRQTEEVRIALAVLVANGLVLERTVGSAGPSYRLNWEKFGELRPPSGKLN
jgi:hypothetical protein